MTAREREISLPLKSNGSTPAAAPAPPRTALAPILSGSERDSYASTAFGDVIDRSLHAATARFTAGLSPAALAEAYTDWATHLASSPGKRMQLLEKATKKAVRLARHSSQCLLEGRGDTCCIEPLPQDRRFVGEAWQSWPYNLVAACSERSMTLPSAVEA